MSTTWSFDQILNLAPDAASAKAGQGLATPGKWQSLGKSDRALWGECKGSGSDPYRTAIDLGEPAFKCSCPSRKYPCKHGLGLLFLYAAHPSALQEISPADWAREWIEGRDQREERKKEQKEGEKSSDPAGNEQRAKAKQKRVEQREAKVRAGVDELQRWMFDMVRQGISAMPTAADHFWKRMASRLIDAQAPGLARRVTGMSLLRHSSRKWNEDLTAALGELQLLIEAYNRLDELPEGIAAEVRTEIGWRIEEEDLLREEGMRDRWLVLGQNTFDEDRLRVQRTWLRGRQSGQSALLLNFAAGQKGLEIQFVPGTEFEGELVFYPASRPQRAVLKKRLSPIEPIQGLPAAESIEQLLDNYATALAASPWLSLFPTVIGGVIPRLADGLLLLQDSTNAVLPVVPDFTFPWELIVLSGGTPILLFGEWNGEHLLPLTVWADGRQVRLSNSSFSTGV